MPYKAESQLLSQKQLQVTQDPLYSGVLITLWRIICDNSWLDTHYPFLIDKSCFGDTVDKLIKLGIILKRIVHLKILIQSSFTHTSFQTWMTFFRSNIILSLRFKAQKNGKHFWSFEVMILQIEFYRISWTHTVFVMVVIVLLF